MSESITPIGVFRVLGGSLLLSVCGFELQVVLLGAILFLATDVAFTARRVLQHRVNALEERLARCEALAEAGDEASLAVGESLQPELY